MVCGNLWIGPREKEDLAQKESIAGFCFGDRREKKPHSCRCFGKAGAFPGWWALLDLPFPSRGSGGASQRGGRLLVPLHVPEQERLLCCSEVSASLCTTSQPATSDPGATDQPENWVLNLHIGNQTKKTPKKERKSKVTLPLATAVIPAMKAPISGELLWQCDGD